MSPSKKLHTLDTTLRLPSSNREHTIQQWRSSIQHKPHRRQPARKPPVDPDSESPIHDDDEDALNPGDPYADYAQEREFCPSSESDSEVDELNAPQSPTMAHFTEPEPHPVSPDPDHHHRRHRHRRRKHSEEHRHHRRKVRVTEEADYPHPEKYDLYDRRRSSSASWYCAEDNIQTIAPISIVKPPEPKRSSRIESSRKSRSAVTAGSEDVKRKDPIRRSQTIKSPKVEIKQTEKRTDSKRRSLSLILKNNVKDPKSSKQPKSPKVEKSSSNPASPTKDLVLSRDSANKSASPTKTGKKSQGFFSTLLFGAPPPPPREKKITCLTCFSDDVPVSKSAKLACSHRMCHACLRRIFTMSVSDPQHMPPRCCTADHIPLKHVDKLFDMKFKTKWNRKYQEYTTKNRIYCPAKGCGEWIKPSNIYLDTSSGATGGRKYGKCGRCKTKVCCTCNEKWHTRKDCPKDEATKKFIEIAEDEGWKRCYNCSAMVELKEGCNHMTCRCTAEFCMVCGSKWKTCDCPWFNYETVEGDRLNHMNLPQARMVYNEPDGEWRNPVRYQEEIDRRRRQEERDEHLAQRLQHLLGIDDDDHDPAGMPDDGRFNPMNPDPNTLMGRFVINAYRDHMNEGWNRNGAHTPPLPPEDRVMLLPD